MLALSFAQNVPAILAGPARTTVSGRSRFRDTPPARTGADGSGVGDLGPEQALTFRSVSAKPTKIASTRRRRSTKRVSGLAQSGGIGRSDDSHVEEDVS